MFGYGTPIGTHFAPHHPAYVDLTGQSNYDPELSKKLLAEAGFPDGFTTTLKLPPPAYARKGGEIIAYGTPEEVSNSKKSFTGNFLKQHLFRLQREYLLI